MKSLSDTFLPAATPRTSLKGSDVVFMYPAANHETYIEYGCTFLAWGGAAKGEDARRLESIGVHGTGTLWCLTAGAENLHKDADLRDAVCRDVQGNPIAVWWLFDCTFEGTPSWFGCSNHPAFRAFLRQRVAEEMRGGAPGLHVDDHLGTAHSVAFLGGCFCDHCMAAFREWLKQNAARKTMDKAGVSTWHGFDYRHLVRQHAADNAAYQAKKESIPLYFEFLDCQLQLAAENVRQLGELAAEIVQHPITLSANTALPELPHLAVAPQLTHLVGEVPHRASHGTGELLEAVFAYRMAEAMGKPVAATAQGYDWAWAKETGSTNLVKIWIALGYCAGQRLMAPHRQWCFTKEKGTHWYDGPAEAYAPPYRFVRKHPELFEGTTTLGPLAVPVDMPIDVSRHAGRLALQAALKAGNPRPIQAGPAWVFPRRAANGTIVIHLLNLDYAADGDRIQPCRDLRIALPDECDCKAATATVYAFDAEPITVAIHRANGAANVMIPELRIWSIVVVDHA